MVWGGLTFGLSAVFGQPEAAERRRPRFYSRWNRLLLRRTRTQKRAKERIRGELGSGSGGNNTLADSAMAEAAVIASLPARLTTATSGDGGVPRSLGGGAAVAAFGSKATLQPMPARIVRPLGGAAAAGAKAASSPSVSSPNAATRSGGGALVTAEPEGDGLLGQGNTRLANDGVRQHQQEHAVLDIDTDMNELEEAQDHSSFWATQREQVIRVRFYIIRNARI